MQAFRQGVEQLPQVAQQAGNDPAKVAEAQAAVLTRLRDARQAYLEAGAESTRDPEVLKEYIEVAGNLGAYALMAQALRRLTRIEADDAEPWLQLGQALVVLGPEQFTEAAQAFRRVLDLQVDKKVAAAAYAGLGTLYASEKLYDVAREHHQKALEADPDHVESKLALAALDIREGRMKEAADALQALGDLPNTPDMAAGFGRAVKDFVDARRTFADTAENHIAYAQILIRANRLAESVWPLQRAAELTPDNVVPWNMLGSIRLALGDLPGAQAAFERSLQVNPDQPRTRESLEEVRKQAVPAPSPLLPQAPGME